MPLIRRRDTLVRCVAPGQATQMQQSSGQEVHHDLYGKSWWHAAKSQRVSQIKARLPEKGRIMFTFRARAYIFSAKPHQFV